MRIEGRATSEGTARYRARFPAAAGAGHFRRFGDLWLSSIGLGTYLGDADDVTDRAYEAAVGEALGRGCNVFDTAINYRHQHSERALGRALALAFDRGLAARDEVFISTKGGFLPFDGEVPDDRVAYYRKMYIDTGVLAESDIVAGCHALTPGFISHQLDASRSNLGLETVDLYYLHNPETQLRAVALEELERRLSGAAEVLRESLRQKRIGAYGLATWNAFRRAPGEPEHLALERLVEPARETPAKVEASFRAVQLPLNLAMPEALALGTQPFAAATVPALVAARALGLAVFASASILQGRLAASLPADIASAFPDLASDVQRALQFTRSAPGITTALVGMADAGHVRENLELAGVPPAAPEDLQKLFG